MSVFLLVEFSPKAHDALTGENETAKVFVGHGFEHPQFLVSVDRRS